MSAGLDFSAPMTEHNCTLPCCRCAVCSECGESQTHAFATDGEPGAPKVCPKCELAGLDRVDLAKFARWLWTHGARNAVLSMLEKSDEFAEEYQDFLEERARRDRERAA